MKRKYGFRKRIYHQEEELKNSLKPVVIQTVHNFP